MLVPQWPKQNPDPFLQTVSYWMKAPNANPTVPANKSALAWPRFPSRPQDFQPQTRNRKGGTRRTWCTRGVRRKWDGRGCFLLCKHSGVKNKVEKYGGPSVLLPCVCRGEVQMWSGVTKEVDTSDVRRCFTVSGRNTGKRLDDTAVFTFPAQSRRPLLQKINLSWNLPRKLTQKFLSVCNRYQCQTRNKVQRRVWVMNNDSFEFPSKQIDSWRFKKAFQILNYVVYILVVPFFYMLVSWHERLCIAWCCPA